MDYFFVARHNLLVMVSETKHPYSANAHAHGDCAGYRDFSPCSK